MADFAARCYEILKNVPKGRVTTYKLLAQAMGTKAYRAVGSALNKNPFAPKVPCHRVVNSNGLVGGFATGTAAKIKILKKEGLRISGKKICDFEKVLYIPK